MKGASIAGVVVLMVWLSFTGGCGYKKPPLPPNSVVPQAINDLRHAIDTKGVELTWSYPVDTIKGTNIEAIDSFALFRAVVPLADYCGTCPVPFGEPLDLPGGQNTVETRRKGKYQESLLRTGHRYFYKIRSRTSWWASSKDSNIVSFTWHIPAKAPEGLVLTSEGKHLVLSWKPVTLLLDGTTASAPLKYQVLRSIGGKGFKNLGKPRSKVSYVDKDVEKGNKYFYKVQSVMDVEGELAKGGVSKVVNAVPKDVTPPMVVMGVTAVRTSSGIKVIWDPGSDADLAGYRVYRRTGKEKDWQLLGDVGLSYTIFVDDDVPEGAKVFYSVSAVDEAEPANESLKSDEATLRH